MFNVTLNASIADSVLLDNSVEWKSIELERGRGGSDGESKVTTSLDDA